MYYKSEEIYIPIFTFNKSLLASSSLVRYLQFLIKEHSIGSEKIYLILSLD